MYKAKIISVDFEESTMEFEIQHEFIAKCGEYVILTKEEFEELSEKANSSKIEMPFLKVNPPKPLEYKKANVTTEEDIDYGK